MGYKIYVPVNENQLSENLQDIWIDSKLDSDANAVSASKLFTGRNLKVSLASDDEQYFDGTSDATVIGVGGILPTQKGGTGKDDLDKVIVGGAKSLNSAHSLKVSLPSDSAPTFNGTADVTVIGTAGILPTQKGGTGQDDLNKVTVGKANTLTNARSFKVSLESDNVPSFNGTSAVTIGTFGILPTQKGGTGQNDLNKVTVGKANTLTNTQYLKVSLESNDAQSFNGTSAATVIGTAGILPTQKGGTGQNDLNKVTVGKANTLTNTQYLKVDLNSTSAQSFNGTAPATLIGVGGTLQPAYGGTGQSNLNNVTVGAANRDGSGRNIVDTYVVKESGKGLSSNDFTTTYKNKLDGIANNAQVNVIETVKVNNTALTPTNKAVNIDLTNYVTKSDVASALIYRGNVNSFSALPTNANNGDVYNIATAGGTDSSGVAIKAGDNVVFNGTGWDVLAGTVDLSGYVTKDGSKVLSTNDYTTAEKNKLAGIADNANNYVLPTASGSQLGGVKIGSNININNGTISITKDNVTNALGYTPPTTNTTYNNATTTTDGLMSAGDKAKLDAISNNAQVNVIETVKVNNTALNPDNNKAVNIDLSGYLTNSNAANTYLSTAAAATIYATKDEAGGGGISQAELANVTVGAATSDGQGRNIANTYLTTQNAANTYLTTQNAANTYLPLSGGTLSGKLTGTDIKANSIKGLGSHYFGTCATASNVSLKAVTCSDFELAAGAILTVKFDHYVATRNIALNVNKTGAYDVVSGFEADEAAVVYDDDENAFKSPAISDGNFTSFIFNGSNWALYGDNNTTESLNGLIRSGQSVALSYLQMGRGKCPIYYGYSTTAADTIPKLITCPEWTSDTLLHDAIIIVKFDKTNSSVTKPSLNINGTGAFNFQAVHGRASANAAKFRGNSTYAIKWKASTQKYYLLQSFEYNPRMAWYVTCSTAADVAAKTVDLDTDPEVRSFCLRHGTRVTLNLLNDNTAGYVTLNINRTGDKNIYFGTGRVSSTRFKAGIYDLIYNGISDQYEVTSSLNFTALGTASIGTEGAMWLSWA